MIADPTDTRNVLFFPRPASSAVASERRGTAMASSPSRTRPRCTVDDQPRWSRRVSSVGDLTLRWVVDSILLGLAFAAAAHGPVSPDMLDAIEDMERRRRQASGALPD
jgi:hypothetical protein